LNLVLFAGLLIETALEPNRGVGGGGGAGDLKTNKPNNTNKHKKCLPTEKELFVLFIGAHIQGIMQIMVNTVFFPSHGKRIINTNQDKRINICDCVNT
jgi:hypothetical protein